MSIIINHLSYIHPDKQLLFQEISFTVNKGEKASLIGNNGSGKSTLLQIIAENLESSSGNVFVEGALYFVPQHFGQYDHLSVAEALGISKKIEALHAILQGGSDVSLFTDLDDDWGIEEKVQAAFTSWEIPEVSLSQKMNTLSGGEKTKVFLSGILIHEPSVILFDEPTNHLDWEGRQQLYNFITSVRKTMLIVSHDRTLLNLIEKTFEMGDNGITVYGGNYDFYKMQKEEQNRALFDQVEEQEKALRKARLLARKVQERKQKQDVRGKRAAEAKGIPRIMMDTIRDKAESTASKLDSVHTGKIAGIHEELKHLREKAGKAQVLKTDLENARLHKGKVLIEAHHINVSLEQNENLLWERPLSFTLLSGDRFVLTGRNGSGKTTLLKLITGELTPSVGSIKRSDCQILYIDQEYSLLNPGITVLEQLEQYNERHLPEHELKIILHRFVFPIQTWDKKVENLSGGEKMRLLFCCLTVKNHAPDLFILDEPANNLDIQSLEIVTDTIRNYKGTLLLVSHDQYLIEEAAVEILNIDSLTDG